MFQKRIRLHGFADNPQIVRLSVYDPQNTPGL